MLQIRKLRIFRDFAMRLQNHNIVPRLVKERSEQIG